MIEKWFSLTLIDDLVLTADASTEKGHQCLDYIPGAALRGAALSLEMRSGKNFSPENYFSTGIQFSNAYPLSDAQHILMPMPRIFQIKKGQTLSPQREIPVHNPILANLKKEMRRIASPYIDPESGTVDAPEILYSMKTAIDRTSGRAKDSMLFGYSALKAGQCFAFKVSYDEQFTDSANSWITRLLQDHPRLGRSRSAEFSRVKVQELPAPPLGHPCGQPSQRYRIFYAASDVCLKHHGVATRFPSPEQLGLPTGKWNARPDISEMKWRSYAPWNQFHHCRMRERMVIEKGSVWVYEATSTETPPIENGILSLGQHTEEGLGEVWVNPKFLLKEPFLLRKETRTSPQTNSSFQKADTLLLRRLKNIAERDETFDESEKLQKEWKSKLMDDQKISSAQWSQIRTLCQQHGNSSERLMTEIKKFCTNGLRKKRWAKTWPKLEDILTKSDPSDPAKARALCVMARDIARECMTDDSEREDK